MRLNRLNLRGLWFFFIFVQRLLYRIRLMDVQNYLHMRKFLLFVGVFLLTTAGFAQTEVPAFGEQGSAEIDLNKCVTLDNSTEVQNFYVLDISHLGLASENDAWDYFNYISDNLLTYHVFYSDMKVTLELHLERTGEAKDINWWNSYLETKCDK